MSKLIQTADGSSSLISAKFNESYHSKHGAIQESQVVFIDAALTPKIQAKTSSLSILDIGFGSGLNALMTLLHTKNSSTKIHYTAVEAYPISHDTAQELNYSNILNCQDLQSSFIEMHDAEANTLVELSTNFFFKKQIEYFENIKDINQYDIIYFDAFAPSSQPELWEKPLLEAMYNALKKDGILSTYCAKGVFKRTLKSIGFIVEGLPGPVGKREITRAIKV